MNPASTVPGIALINGKIPAASVDNENRPCGCGGGGGVGCAKPDVPWANCPHHCINCGEVVHGQACGRSVDPDYSEVGRYVPIQPLLLSACGQADYNRLGAIVCNHCYDTTHCYESDSIDRSLLESASTSDGSDEAPAVDGGGSGTSSVTAAGGGRLI